MIGDSQADYLSRAIAFVARAAGAGEARAGVNAEPAQVLGVETALEKKRYDPGPIDGIMCMTTGSGLRSFRNARGRQAAGESSAGKLSTLGVITAGGVIGATGTELAKTGIGSGPRPHWNPGCRTATARSDRRAISRFPARSEQVW
jgi:hypothetical protein